MPDFRRLGQVAHLAHDLRGGQARRLIDDQPAIERQAFALPGQALFGFRHVLLQQVIDMLSVIKRCIGHELDRRRIAQLDLLRQFAAQIGRGAGSGALTSLAGSSAANGITKAVALRRSGLHFTSPIVGSSPCRSGSRKCACRRMPTSAWRIASPTRSWRWVGPVEGLGFITVQIIALGPMNQFLKAFLAI